jgi:hypothetical protein
MLIYPFNFRGLFTKFLNIKYRFIFCSIVFTRLPRPFAFDLSIYQFSSECDQVNDPVTSMPYLDLHVT